MSGQADAGEERFWEWAAIPYERRRTWSRHLDAALDAAAHRRPGR